ncbi:MAG: nucleotidyltransferase family protein [bacterium]
MIGSAELQVIQATLRVDEGRDASIRETASKQLDWHKVRSLAQHHGVSPLVYKRLKEVALDLVPPAVMQEMAAFQKANELRVIQMTADLIRVVRALEAENIPVICLKGPVLAQVLYGDPAMRLFGDLDILVPPDCMHRVEEILKTIGVKPIINECHPDEVITEQELTNDWERSYLFHNQRHLLEVHWKITDADFQHAFNIDEIFSSNQGVVLNGHTIKTLNTEDTALYLCYHGTHHCWMKYRYLDDFTSALRNIDVSKWEQLLSSSASRGLRLPLLVTLGLCQYLLGLELPQEVSKNIRYNWLAHYTTRIALSYLGRYTTTGPDLLEKQIVNILTSSKPFLNNTLPLLDGMFVPTDQDFEWVSLPAGLRWLYPLLRPIRRIAKGIGMICSRN